MQPVREYGDVRKVWGDISQDMAQFGAEERATREFERGTRAPNENIVKRASRLNGLVYGFINQADNEGGVLEKGLVKLMAQGYANAAVAEAMAAVAPAKKGPQAMASL